MEEEDRAEADEDIDDFEAMPALPNSSMDTGGNATDRLAVLRRMAAAAQRLSDARLAEIVVWQCKQTFG